MLFAIFPSNYYTNSTIHSTDIYWAVNYMPGAMRGTEYKFE